MDGLDGQTLVRPVRPKTHIDALLRLSAMIVLITVFASIQVGCARAPQQPMTPSSQGQDDLVGMSAGFAPVANESSGSPAVGEIGWTRRQWTLRSGSPLMGYYAIENYADEARPFRLVAFVDYEQVEIDVAGLVNRSQDVTIQPYVRAEQLVRVDGISAGSHELLTVLFVDPLDDDTVAPEGILYDDEGYVAQRMMLTVGVAQPRPTALSAVSGRASGNASGLDGVVLNQSATDPQSKLVAVDANAGTEMQLYAHIANPTTQTAEYALIGLLDHEQTELAGASVALRVRVPASSILSVPLAVRAPAKPGRHQLVVLRALRPLQPLGERFLIQDGVAASRRVAVVVR